MTPSSERLSGSSCMEERERERAQIQRRCHFEVLPLSQPPIQALMRALIGQENLIIQPY